MGLSVCVFSFLYELLYELLYIDVTDIGNLKIPIKVREGFRGDG